MFPFAQLVSTKTSGCAYAAIVLRSGLSEVLHRYIACAYAYSYPTIGADCGAQLDDRVRTRLGRTVTSAAHVQIAKARITGRRECRGRGPCASGEESCAAHGD